MFSKVAIFNGVVEYGYDPLIHNDQAKVTCHGQWVEDVGPTTFIDLAIMGFNGHLDGPVQVLLCHCSH